MKTHYRIAAIVAALFISFYLLTAGLPGQGLYLFYPIAIPGVYNGSKYTPAFEILLPCIVCLLVCKVRLIQKDNPLL